jgi:hypothetical protein
LLSLTSFIFIFILLYFLYLSLYPIPLHPFPFTPHTFSRMHVQLLPASAAAYAPRASVNVVLKSKVEPWLTQTLKRVNRVKRPLNSVLQHQRCLTDVLSSATAMWTLASLILTKAPDAQLEQDSDSPALAVDMYQIIHLEAYVVHVDMVLSNEVAFKLTKDSIDALVGYHKDVHCPNTKASTHDWSEKDQQCKKLHNDFVQAINKFVFRAPVSALEGLEEDGSGELLCGKSEEVKTNILGLMKPLLPPPPPPPPRMVDVVRQPPLLPNSTSMWSQPTPAPVEAWRILPSSPGVPSSSATSPAASIWASVGLGDLQMPSHMSSPPSAPAMTLPYTTAGLYYSSPVVSSPVMALPSLQLPSMLSPPCGMGMGVGAFGWERYHEYTTTI